MELIEAKKIFITGGLGFIGYNLVKFLTNQNHKCEIIIFDNNSINNTPAISYYQSLPQVKIIYADLLEADKIHNSLKGSDLVIHLAANSDISKGVFNPHIDFQNTVCTTFNLLSAMLAVGVTNIIFSSGSGVYGDVSNIFIPENYGPLVPVSHYGASKLCAESLISSFVHMHNFKAWIFRFANVIGDGQTHGVAYDFINRLRKNPKELVVLGNGYQNKSYILVDDIINGINLVLSNSDDSINFYNISTEDAITVRQIVEIILEEMELQNTKIIYGDTPFGWRGDVPVINLDASRIRSLGWKCQNNSYDAMKLSVRFMLNKTK